MKTKLVPFDIEKAKNGAKVVTRDGHHVKITAHYLNTVKTYPITGEITETGESLTFTKEGRFSPYEATNNDLFIEEEIENKTLKNENKNMKTKLIPFDLAKAKAGAKIVNRDGNSIRIVCDDVISGVKGFNLLVLEKVKETERPYLCRKNGKANLNKSKESVGDLFIEEEEEGVTQLKKKKQGEQKPINNIKPKFKVGDYIINDSVNMKGKIVKLTDHSYQLSSGQCIPFEDNRTRLWEVAKDAKPGDVLASEYWDDILIFKQIDDRVGFSSYYNINQERNNSWVNDYFRPATKKQRKQLFQKMKEEGYEWDPVKKELKKIENEGKVKEEVKTRRMTNQELSWWLRECPEEHREYCNKERTAAYWRYFYYLDVANKEVEEGILIRRNGGEWEEPLIEIK